MEHGAKALIDQLQLAAHPEGGWYREVFRSSGSVNPPDGRGLRSALTSIYFLLETGQRSRWHLVTSDEVWVHLQGDPLDLWAWDAPDGVPVCTVLGPLARSRVPQHVIPAGQWQAAEPHATLPPAEPASGYTLVACIVGPGFDFSDFSFMESGGVAARVLERNHPSLARFI